MINKMQIAGRIRTCWPVGSCASASVRRRRL